MGRYIKVRRIASSVQLPFANRLNSQFLKLMPVIATSGKHRDVEHMDMFKDWASAPLRTDSAQSPMKKLSPVKAKDASPRSRPFPAERKLNTVGSRAKRPARSIERVDYAILHDPDVLMGNEDTDQAL